MEYIVQPKVRQYVEQLIPKKNDFFTEMEQYAEENFVPIICKESLRMMESILLLHRPKKIIEIGTAIGYSSLNFCRILNGECKIKTYERNLKRYETALDFIARSPYNNQVEVVLSDAAENLILEEEYDMAFIDAAKGQYQYFFDNIYPYIKKGGILVSDNIFFRGQVCEDTQMEVTRRNRTIYRRMNDYLHFLMAECKEFHSSLIPIGDGMALTIKRREEDE